MAGSATLSTSVSVGFNEPAPAPQGSGGQQYVMEESGRPPITTLPLRKYFRVHPSAAGLRLVTTSGSVSASTSYMSKAADEVVTFSGKDVLGYLRYPGATDVVYNTIGNLIGATGGTANVTFDYARNALIADRPCFGSVHVGYRAPFDLWLATFDGVEDSPTRANASPEDDNPNTSQAMSILAYRASPTADQDPYEVVASLTLSPPTVAGTTTTPPGIPPGTTPANPGSTLADTKANLPQMRFEIDPAYPPRLLPAESGMAAGVKVRIVPAVKPDIEMTSGQIVRWDENPGGLAVEQLLTFSGSMSASLQYQPEGTTTLVAVGTFVDQWGRSFSPTLAGPGTRIGVVEWVDSNTVRNQRSRVVQADEVVVCDMFNNAIPAYGIVRAAYSYSFRTFDFRFDYDEKTSQFRSAFVVGLNNGQVANIQLTPPTMKGIK